jgi:D-3-phosphoglycerate dehydrogenase / 2-oxoglutarate reductase
VRAERATASLAISALDCRGERSDGDEPAHVQSHRHMNAVFVDATPALASFAHELLRVDGIAFRINRDPDVRPDALPALLAGAVVAIVDHTPVPTAIAKQCVDLRHVIFLGTGARSYMSVEELAALGIHVHVIKGYGDTAVAECAIALMWAAARGIARMDREMRGGTWLRTEGIELTGRTLGLVGFGSIATEVARIALGGGMRVIAWNRSAKTHAGVAFVSLERLLAESDVVSMHLLLSDETRGFLSRARIAVMRPGAILVNTARGALVDEAAMIDALRDGHLRHAGLDVYDVEPLPPGHALTTLPNVTLSAHSAFRTPEASRNLIAAAREHCRRIIGAQAAEGAQ